MTNRTHWARIALESFFSLPGIALYLCYRLRLVQFVTGSRLLALVPGHPGVLFRRSWYRLGLNSCGKNLYVDWMAAIKTPKTSVGDHVFIGTFTWIGWAEIGNDVMLGGHDVILSGGRHHAFDRLDIPMNRQEINLSPIRIGNDVWVGNGCIIMSDIPNGCVVGAGAVVNKTFEDNSVIVGVPARVVRRRGSGPQPEGQAHPHSNLVL